MDEFSFSGFLWRLVFSVALVLLTFNPTGHSYYHWLLDGFPSITPGEAVAGVVLLGAWIFFVRSTLAAMGALGVGLLLALFASIVWWVTSRGWLDLGNRNAMAWVVLGVLGVVLGVGLSWSKVRQHATGQVEAD